MRIVLATTSPYRIEIMKLLGIPFETKESDVEEKFEGRPKDPEGLVTKLSKSKAEAVAKYYDDALVFGFDSVGYFDGRILEKPKSRKEAFDRLKMMAGKSHEHYTGVTLIDTKTKERYYKVIKSKVSLRNFSEEEINRYLEQDDGWKKHAYGYEAIGQLSSTFIKHFEGDFFSFARGMPIAAVREMISGARE